MNGKLILSVDLLQCPVTGCPLEEIDGELATVDGRRRYHVIDGVPILLPEELSIFSGADSYDHAVGAGRTRRVRHVVRRLLPGNSPLIGTAGRFVHFRQELLRRTAGRPSMVLVIGGGILGAGMSVLADSTDVELIETDVYLGPRVSVVCDGHDLPFIPETFDGVIVQAVLEHVLDPQRVIREIHRVLRPGGLVYAETPFMQQVHEGAYDFTRWTELGHRRLFRMFKEIDRGISAGPGTVLLWSLCYLARSIPRRSSSIQLLLEKLTLLTFFWLKHVDRLVVTHVGAIDGASGVFFMGSKAEQPIDDAELLAGYRGSIGRPIRMG